MNRKCIFMRFWPAHFGTSSRARGQIVDLSTSHTIFLSRFRDGAQESVSCAAKHRLSSSARMHQFPRTFMRAFLVRQVFRWLQSELCFVKEKMVVVSSHISTALGFRAQKLWWCQLAAAPM